MNGREKKEKEKKKSIVTAKRKLQRASVLLRFCFFGPIITLTMNTTEEAKHETSSSNGVDNSGETDKKRESSSRDVNSPASAPFGGRILVDESAVFEQNAW